MNFLTLIAVFFAFAGGATSEHVYRIWGGTQVARTNIDSPSLTTFAALWNIECLKLLNRVGILSGYLSKANDTGN
jgi:hypothetical protein